MKKVLSAIVATSIIFSVTAAQTISVSAETAYPETYRNVNMNDTWLKAAGDVTSDAAKWTFTAGNTEKPGWATYMDYNTPLSLEKTGSGVYSNITSLSRNTRGRTGIYHKSIQAETGGRILQFTGGSYKNFAVTFDIQALNTWNETAGRKSSFDFGLIDESLKVEQLTEGYKGQNYVHLDGALDMQNVTLPSGAADGEISTRAAVINTNTAADYPGAEVVTKTDSITGAEYIESVTENGKTTYWNQVINCKVVVVGDVMSIYMKFEDADTWKKIKSYGIPNAGFGKINKRFYVVCSGFQMLVSNLDIWQKAVDVSESEAEFTKTDDGYTVEVPIINNTGAALNAILAAYKEGENKRIEDVAVYNVAADGKTAKFNISSASDIPKFKLFFWNDTNQIVPITDALTMQPAK